LALRRQKRLTENLDNLPGIARRREKERQKRKEESKNTKSEYLLKICIIGSCDKLKTKFVRKYAEDKFDGDHSPTLGVDISTKKIIAKDTKTKLILVDTPSPKFFGKLRPNYYRGASAGIIVFDKSDRESFEKVTFWLEDLRKNTGSNQSLSVYERNIHEIPKEIVKE
jgi:GTPase SAR1 family protein